MFEIEWGKREVPWPIGSSDLEGNGEQFEVFLCLLATEAATEGWATSKSMSISLTIL